MKEINELYTAADHNGESIYYTDKYLKNPYTGILVETSANGTIIWWSELVDGSQNGIEKNFDSEGRLQQISECKKNMHSGISKEYDESESLFYVSIKWNNGTLKSLKLDSNLRITNIEENKPLINNPILPLSLKELLRLSDNELINYEFSYTLCGKWSSLLMYITKTIRLK